MSDIIFATRLPALAKFAPSEQTDTENVLMDLGEYKPLVYSTH